MPYTTEPSIDDTQNYQIPATDFNTILHSLIQDLEGCKDDAVRRYYLDDNSNAFVNSSRITRWAIRAILADMYLWAGEYEKCIQACDEIIEYKKSQYEEMLTDPDVRAKALRSIALFNGVPLILESPLNSSIETSRGDAYDAIFGEGNSFESLSSCIAIADTVIRTNTCLRTITMKGMTVISVS